MSAVFSVSDLNQYVGEVLAADPVLTAVRVRGEISGFKKYPSGHLYFSLKDKESQVNCVAFRGNAAHFSFVPENGMSVVVTARASLYDRDGRFQLVVYEMEKDGVGDLFAAFERLKVKLEAEGLFDTSHKKAIPKLPRRIGVVTSPKGAVISDIIHVLSRRFPNFDLLIYPSAVQGQTAAGEIRKGVEWFNRTDIVDVIIIARGGGSMEDLWCFNDEALARTIYESNIPLISAVGHETDFTICDFVSDLRAPTPSAAAELVMPEKSELLSGINARTDRLTRALLHLVAIRKNHLMFLSRSKALLSPLRRVESESQRLDMLSLKLTHSLNRRMDSSARRIDKGIARLDALSPLKVLSRGYSLATNPATGSCITSIAQVTPGQAVQIQLADGLVHCKAETIQAGRIL